MMILTNLVAILALWTGGDTLHAQEVRCRSSVTDWQKGTIVVTEDAITFDATKADFPEMYRLSINRVDVIAVKREWYYLSQIGAYRNLWDLQIRVGDVFALHKVNQLPSESRKGMKLRLAVG